MSPEKYFTQAQKDAMVTAIEEAEKCTSGEIRVHFQNHCQTDPLDNAVEIFEKLKMHETEQRNGVLIFIALQDKKMAILGDAGINAKVSDNFWDNIKNRMVNKFKSGQICEGICEAVKETGIQLKTYFPYQKDDINELSNDLSFKE